MQILSLMNHKTNFTGVEAWNSEKWSNAASITAINGEEVIFKNLEAVYALSV
jgi:hypothetical protein